jgi:hypothetical protein
MPVYHPMSPNEEYPLLATIGISLILEMVRALRNGKLTTNGTALEDRTIDLVEKNIVTIGLIAILLGAGVLLMYEKPDEWVSWFLQGLKIASGERSVVHQTVSEQNPMVTPIGDHMKDGDDLYTAISKAFKEYLSEGYKRYGVALLYGLIMIIALPIYTATTKKGYAGAIFLLTWSIPMMWGAFNKSAWIFASGAAVTALGATVGLFAAAKKADLDGLRVVGTIMAVFIPVFYVPMFGITGYSNFVGYGVMHMGPTADIYYWEPQLEWHRDNTKAGDAVLTWWDYGHWLTAVSHRPVLIDNLQADYYEIQDVARFFMNKTSEEDAFKIVKAYNQAYKDKAKGYGGDFKYKDQEWGLNYAAIDWTMIGKGSALHYIATGDIENVTPGSWKNYMQCWFEAGQSQIDEKLEVNSKDGSLSKMRHLTFNCQDQILIVFDIADDSIKDINVVTGYQTTLPWSSWSKGTDASLLGVEPLIGMNSERTPSILYCAMNWNKLPERSICRLPQFHTLVYVPQEFNDFMMTRLYLGKYLDEYKAFGLYNREVKPLVHFREVPDYDGDGTPDGEFSYGFVRSYEISYEGFSNTTSTGNARAAP